MLYSYTIGLFTEIKLRGAQIRKNSEYSAMMFQAGLKGIPELNHSEQNFVVHVELTVSETLQDG